MAHPAMDRAKRNMVEQGLKRLRAGGLLNRTQIFGEGPEFRDVQKRILKSLQEMGVIRKVGTANPSVVLFTVHNNQMLDSVLKSETEITRLAFPGAAPPPEPETPQEEPEEEVQPPVEPEQPALQIATSPTTQDSDLKKLLGDILERQDLILQKVVDPIGENTIWVRDQVIKLQESVINIKTTVARIYEILRKLE
jgi:hypothetical protein